MDFQHGDRSRDVLQRVRAFLRTHVEPVESRYWSEVHAENPGGDWRAWRIHPLLEEQGDRYLELASAETYRAAPPVVAR